MSFKQTLSKHEFLLCLFLILGSITSSFARSYYVSNVGNMSNSGDDFNQSITLLEAISRVSSGDEIIMKSETYVMNYSSNFSEGSSNTIFLSKSGSSENEIIIRSENGLKTTIDFSFPEGQWVQNSFGFDITGSYWCFKNIDITRAGYQGVYVKGGYNTFENCRFYNNRNTGLEINKGGHHTTVINCDAYRNFDPKKNGSMADGFGPKQTQGAGNKFIGCRAWENSDDGYDCFDSEETVVFENCWAFRNGVNVWDYSTFEGNGNGFKVGGNHVPANNRLVKCIAFGHPAKGFDQNNNTGGLTLLNCTSYDNGDNYGLGGDLNSGERHYIRNCISFSGSQTISNADHQYNTWNSGFSVSSGDFISLQTSLAMSTRNTDGSIPFNDLFRLKASSSLVDAGIDVNLEFQGSAPDLGAFEVDQNTDCNGVVGGNAYLDDCGVCVSGNTGFMSCVSTIEAEDACEYIGMIEDNNSGFLGQGFVNTTNETGASARWLLNSESTHQVTLSFRYANGGTTSRDGQLSVNGAIVGTVNLPSTGAWDNWAIATNSLELVSGSNEIVLIATSEDGLANLDQLSFSRGVSNAQCVVTSLSSEKNDQANQVFPNPTSGVLNLTQEQTWEIYNSLGEMVLTGKGIEASLSKQPDGVYFVKLENAVSYKIHKQR